MKKLLLALLFISLIGGCMWSKETKNENQPNQNIQAEVKTGDTVEVDYVGKFESGDVFDTSIEQVAKDASLYTTGRDYKPLEFKVGAGQMITGFDQGVVGMKVGETKKLTLAPELAYGKYNTGYVQEVDISIFSGTEFKPEVGKTYQFSVGSAKLIEMSGSKLKFDFNSPMAGKTLIFDVTLKNIKK